MERDFMGLNSKESLVVVKEEVCDTAKDSGHGIKRDSSFLKFYFHGSGMASGMQWPFMNKISTLPHFMRSSMTDEEKPKKIVAGPVAGSSFVHKSNTDAFDSSNKNSVGELKHELHRSRDIEMFPGSNISISMSNPFFKTHFPTTCQNSAGSMVKQQVVGGFPTPATQALLPSAASIAGVTDPWNISKASGSPAQLTIFYAGTVHVYNDIPLEKAQAMMFLAETGSPMVVNAAHQTGQGQRPMSKLAAADCALINQPNIGQPPSGLSSPISVSSHNGTQSATGSTDDVRIAKANPVTIAPVSKMEPPKVVHSLGPMNTTAMIPCAVPQFRKKSLARFLEKRKERVMNSAPYNLGKKFPECGTPEPESSGMSRESSHVLRET